MSVPQVILRAVEFGLCIPAAMIVFHENRPSKREISRTVVYSAVIGAIVGCVSPAGAVATASLATMYAYTTKPDEHSVNLRKINDKLAKYPDVHDVFCKLESNIENLI